jgi:hypothetical protein
MQANSKNQPLLILSIYSFIIIISLILYGYQYPSSQLLLEIPPIMSILDPELYKNDLFVQSNSSFTPRFYYQHLISLTSNLGLNLSLSHFLYYLIAFASFLLGLYALGKKFGRSQLSASILAFLGLMSAGGTVGYVSIFRAEPIPAVLAMGLVVWGFYFCFCQRWVLGYFFFGLSALIHILVGLLPGGLMIPVLLLEVKKNKNFRTLILSLLTFAALVGLVYVPMAVTGATGTTELSNKEFVDLYGYIRAPHHFIPSTFPVQEWRSFFGYTLGGILLISSSDTLNSDEKKSFTIIICTSFLALLLGYIFVELYPLAFINKLQLARTTPFAKLMVLIAISVLINEHYRKGNISLCVLLLVAPIIKNGAILLLLVAIGLVILKATNQQKILRERSLIAISVVGSLLLLALYPLPGSIQEIFNRIFWQLILFLVLAIPFFLEEFCSDNRRIGIVAYPLSVGAFTFLILGLFNFLPRNLSHFFETRIQISEEPQLTDRLDNLTKLALRFKAQSDRDALFLIPPSLSQFRLYSQRAVVADLRSFPFTDGAIREWRDRMVAILGPLDSRLSWRNVDSFYRQRSASDLVVAARKYRADYILTRTDWHSNILGTVFIQEGKWVIYKIEARNN